MNKKVGFGYSNSNHKCKICGDNAVGKYQDEEIKLVCSVCWFDELNGNERKNIVEATKTLRNKNNE